MTRMSLNQTIPARETWVDAMRAFALFILIMAHCCDPFNSPYLPQTADRAFWGSVYLSAVRPCVPIFVMITGYLLLPCQTESLGICSFDIYMIHYFCVGAAYTSCSTPGGPTAIIIPAATVLALLASWAVVAALKKLPGGLRWLLG